MKNEATTPQASDAWRSARRAFDRELQRRGAGIGPGDAVVGLEPRLQIPPDRAQDLRVVVASVPFVLGFTAFFVLLGSGLVLYLPSLATEVGRRPLVKDVHLLTAVAWIVALAAVLVVGDRRGLRATVAAHARSLDRDVELALDCDLRHPPAGGAEPALAHDYARSSTSSSPGEGASTSTSAGASRRSSSAPSRPMPLSSPATASVSLASTRTAW